uniref:Uncharacterized protein n=1 Tax=Cannabis sativa TaxID=3483 RepID=A0A803PR09_CANSA
MWRSILWERKLIGKEVRWRIKSSVQVKINEDKWIPHPLTFTLRALAAMATGTTLSTLKYSNGTWNEALILGKFHGDTAPFIMGLAPFN